MPPRINVSTWDWIVAWPCVPGENSRTPVAPTASRRPRATPIDLTGIPERERRLGVHVQVHPGSANRIVRAICASPAVAMVGFGMKAGYGEKPPFIWGQSPNRENLARLNRRDR